MRRPFSFFLTASLAGALGSIAALTGCPNTIDTTLNNGGGGMGGGVITVGPTTTSSSGGKDSGKDVEPDYVDPGCPDAGPPPVILECDPFNQNNGQCPPGEGCYIFVQYPDPDVPCSQEVYGATCQAAGQGVQGDSCSNGCAPGFVCVVSPLGVLCVQLCDLTKVDDGCPPGLICQPIDVQGFGGCL